MQTAQDLEKVHSLWDELYKFSAAESERALLYLLESISKWIGADKAHWAAAVRFPVKNVSPDPMLGWRTCAYRSLHQYSRTELELLREIRRQREAGAVDAGHTTLALFSEAGNHRTRRLYDGLVNTECFFRTPHYRLHFERFGIVDRLWSIFPVSDSAEAYFVFDLIKTDRRFSTEDATLVATIIRGLRWLHLRLFLAYGILVAEKPLSPTKRQIVHLLLTGKSEREISLETGQSPATTHKHVEGIYRAFGVNSRAELMSLWLSGA
jgi:DNA-binding CsgD family transcriptional regulator